MSDLNTVKHPDKALRNSNVEIVRILAMLMIITTHLYGTNSGEEFSGAYQAIYLFVSTVFHAGLGVMLFMLMSGYYLIKCSTKRVTKMVTLTWVCSVYNLIVNLISSKISGDEISLKSMLTRLMPISSRYYWYISCYICVMLLSPFLNKAIEKLSKSDYQKLLSVILVLFFIMPTFIYFDIMGDAGKGLVTMISAYFIGAYFAKYPIDLKNKKSSKYICLLLIAINLAAFVGNYAATFARGMETSYPFSRECSITTLASGVLILILATGKTTYNKTVNKISAPTLYIYIIGCTMARLISKLGITFKLKDSFFLAIIMLLLAVAVYALCYLLSLVLRYPAELCNKLLLAVIYKIINIYSHLKERILKKSGALNENSDS